MTFVAKLSENIRSKLSLNLSYRILWLNYLLFHCFASSSQLLPFSSRLILLVTSLLTLVFYQKDKSNHLLAVHKIVFLVLNIHPFSLDNRTTLALFESLAVLIRIGFSKNVPGPLMSANLLGLGLFFAGFHKLNSDHLMSAASCSLALVRDMPFGKYIALLPGLAWIGVIVELTLGLWILIFSKKHFPFFLFAGVSFLFSAAGFHQFMALLWVLALPLLGSVEKHQLKQFLIFSLSCTLVALAAQSWQIGLNLANQSAIVLIVFLTKSDEDQKLKSWSVIIGALFALNCLAPYLGIKNQGSMNMYSNLRVTKNETNHLLLRAPLPLSENALRIVDVTYSNLPSHRLLIERKGQIPLKLLKMQLWRESQRGNPVFIEYVEDGKRHQVKDENLDDFIKDVSFLEYYFLSLGYVPGSHSGCFW
jgi:hypothetical protein